MGGIITIVIWRKNQHHYQKESNLFQGFDNDNLQRTFYHVILLDTKKVDSNKVIFLVTNHSFNELYYSWRHKTFEK